MFYQRPSIQELTPMHGKPVYGSDGEKLGNFEEIYYDTTTGEPEWLGIESSTLGGFLGTKHYLVPLMGAQIQEGSEQRIKVSYPKRQVQDAPQVDGEWVSEETENQLYTHYGIQPSEMRSETQLPESPPPLEGEVGEQTLVGPEGEVTVSRHEEEMRVGKREVEYGRARLRKWVETEPVSEEVSLRRENVQVEREMINRPAPGAELGDGEVEIPLYREEPVVSKETVEKERVTMRPEEEVEQETVRGEVRQEHVELEDDSEERRS